MKTVYNDRIEYRKSEVKVLTLHRENGPALEYTDGKRKGDKAYFIDGRLHRENGPAEIFNNGNKTWWKYGKRHREDGYAIEYKNGGMFYYEGVYYPKIKSNEEWIKFVKVLKLLG